MPHMRIDLDGVPLDDEEGRTTAIFRFRTTRGLVLSLPESVDVTVPLADVVSAGLDLLTGEVRIELCADAGARHRWLGKVRRLVGRWTDRTILTAPPERAPRR